MGVCADPGSFRWCKALSRSRSFATALTNYRLLIIRILILFICTIKHNTLANSLPGKFFFFFVFCFKFYANAIELRSNELFYCGNCDTLVQNALAFLTRKSLFFNCI